MFDVATIVLAAGYSSRMGGAFKPLLQIGVSTVVEHALKSHLDAGIQDVRVVVGHRAGEVVEAVKHLGVSVVTNPDFDRGMFSSVQAGLAALHPKIQAFFIQPVDIPLVDPASIKAILADFQDRPRGIIYPAYRGQRGHPPLIAGVYIPEIMSSPGPEGLRGILRGHEPDARDVEVDNEAVLLDIDTLKDYHHILCYRDRENIPDREQCLRLLDAAGVPEHVREHCFQVNAVACHLVRLLNRAGADLNTDLVSAGAWLHDIKRCERDHARAGAMHVRACGYARVAEIVAVHMDIEVPEGEVPTESEIVYLADKVVMGRSCVPLMERFAGALERHKEDEQACRAIARRFGQAEKIREKVERFMGCLLEDVLPIKTADLQIQIREARLDA